MTAYLGSLKTPPAQPTPAVAYQSLCQRCHALDTTKAYIHGPLASGGCLVCHDPHRSPNRYLLVSASDGFCLHCHDRASLSSLSGSDGHAGENWLTKAAC